MQFETSSTQLSATITELIEHMRQAAYQEGFRESSGQDADDAEPDTDADVLTILRSPLPSSWGEYHPTARLMLLADDLPAEIRRDVVRNLLADPFRDEEPSVRPIRR